MRHSKRVSPAALLTCFVAALLLLAALLACKGSDGGGCKADADCKGNRVCKANRCVESDSGTNPDGAESATEDSLSSTCGEGSLPCRLPDKRVGYCKARRCTDVCPRGYNYDPTDTQCHTVCQPGCSNCLYGHCFDEQTTVPMRE